MKFNKSAKESQLEISDEGIIEGYASVFNGVDSYGDTIAPKAFDHVITKVTYLQCCMVMIQCLCLLANGQRCQLMMQA